jgi:hypothetical protein
MGAGFKKPLYVLYAIWSRLYVGMTPHRMHLEPEMIYH